MLFWIICLILAALVTVIILRPMLRAGTGEKTAGPNDVAVYRDQLAEVERDLARGVLDPAEAERTRTEVARRLLNADRAAEPARTEAPRMASIVVAVLSAVVVVGGGIALYNRLGVPGYPDLPLQTRIANSEEMRQNRPGQAQIEAALDAERRASGEMPQVAPDVPEDYLAMVAQLRQIVPTRLDDLGGWTLLSRHEAALGNYAAARVAQERVIALRGDEATVADRVALADRMVAAANGLVSPEAEAVLTRILSEAPENIAARYYLGLLYAQTDRPDIAFRLFRDVVQDGDAERDLHVRLARSQVEEAAFRAGVTYTLPPIGGPTVADMQAAQDMAPEDRDAMIRGMVANLSDRLATQGGPAEDWARLISAYGVLGDTAVAAEIYAEARGVFGASPEAMAVLAEAAAGAGLAE